jgi:predicted metal-binding protein
MAAKLYTLASANSISVNNNIFKFMLQKSHTIQKDEKLDKELKALAKKSNVSIHEVSPKDIEVGEWVRWKCMFGCKGYGKHLSCPPYVPSPQQTRELLKEYKKAYIIHFRGIPGIKEIDPDKVPANWHAFIAPLILWIHDTLYELEQFAFYSGYYKALALGAYPCYYCEDCVAEQSKGPVDISFKRECRHAEKVRPSMEAVGIDVFATVRKLSLPIEVIPCKDNQYGKFMHPNFDSYGLLLIE